MRRRRTRRVTINLSDNWHEQNAANTAILKDAIDQGYTHILRLKTEYWFFRSPRALTRKIKELGLDPENDAPNGVLKEKTIPWFA